MKIDNALIAALIAIGFFTCEVHAKNYVSKLSAEKKVELLQITQVSLKQHRTIEKSQPQTGGRKCD